MKERGKANQLFQVIRGKVFFGGFLGSSVVKKSTCSAVDAGDACSIPESGRSPGEKNDNQL